MRTYYKLYILILGLLIGHQTQAQIPGSLDSTFQTFSGFTFGMVQKTVLQSTGKIIVIGQFRTYGLDSAGTGILRLNTDGSLDHTFIQGGHSALGIRDIIVLNDDKILICGISSYNGIPCNGIARLNADGSLDNTFNGGSRFTSGSPISMALQPDGKIVLAGSFGSPFSSYNGVPINAIIRLMPDGALDNTFACPYGSVMTTIFNLTVQQDGKIIVSGSFAYTNDQPSNNIFRLNADGSRDNGFTPPPLNTIYDVALQSDGKIILAGVFSTTDYKYLIRLNTNGTHDFSFNARLSLDATARAIEMQPDGKIIVSGFFRKFNTLNADRIVRLLPDGTKDNSFSNDTGLSSNSINTLALQPDGQIVIGGDLTNYQSLSTYGIARIKSNGELDYSFNRGSSNPSKIVMDKDGSILLNASCYANGYLSKHLSRLHSDGTLDETFNAHIDTPPSAQAIFEGVVTAIAIQPDGKIMVGGEFTSINGIPQSHIVRLNSDGSIDPTFHAEIAQYEYVQSIIFQSDGKIIIGGHFSSVNGTAINGVARLNSDGSLDATFMSPISLGFIKQLALLPNGKLVVAGGLDIPGLTYSVFIVRLLANGSLDSTFNFKNYYLSDVDDFAVQTDGKVVLVSSYGNYGHVKRLNTDGSYDHTFNVSTGAAAGVSACAIQNDGKILIAGEFSNFNNGLGGKLVRLNVDGSFDGSFYQGPALPDGTVKDILLQNDGKIILAGQINYVQPYQSYSGVPITHIYRVHGDPIYYNTIKGNVYTDANQNCTLQSSETRLSSMIIKAQSSSNVYYGGSDGYGKYQIKVDSGTIAYTLTQLPNKRLKSISTIQCSEFQTVNLTAAAKVAESYDFADTIHDCSLLSVEIETARLRRCARNSAVVLYTNQGSAAAANAIVKVLLPSYVVPIKTVPTWSSKSGDTLLFNVGTINPGAKGRIIILDSVICGNEQIRGLTQCFQAFISPGSSCLPEDPLWDKSYIQVSGSCLNNNAHFEIINRGVSMTQDLSYSIFSNDTLIYTSTFHITNAQKLVVEYPSVGATIRLEAEQSANYPGISFPSATVEGCGVTDLNTAVKGFVTTNSQDDLDDRRSIACLRIVDSYDPNDKQAMPLGRGADHLIEVGERIKYTVRFQNTGTDTAYTVRVVDTLDVNTDVSSFIEGSSSHPYRLEISGKDRAVLTFNFDNIKLVDSTKNEMMSHGFVSFYVKSKEGLSDGIELNNKADIYFDYNSPVRTNTTFHTIGTYTATDLSKGTDVHVSTGPLAIANAASSNTVEVFPNPASQVVQVRLHQALSDAQFVIQNLFGDEVYSELLKGQNTSVSISTLPSGMYLYKVVSKGELIGVGKLSVK